eukprot:COSAG04_NODE_4008_length_2364_cov_1.700662_2_plen_93_part_00
MSSPVGPAAAAAASCTATPTAAIPTARALIIATNLTLSQRTQQRRRGGLRDVPAAHRLKTIMNAFPYIFYSRNYLYGTQNSAPRTGTAQLVL